MTQTHAAKSPKTNGLAEGLNDAVDRVSHRAEDLRDRAELAALEGKEKLQHAAGEAQAHAELAGEQFVNTIKERPLLALAGAAGIGLLLGMALSKRES